MFDIRSIAKRSGAKKTAMIAAIVLCFYAVAGFLVVPAIIKSKAPAIIEQQLGRQVTVNQIRLNPFALSLTVRGFDLKELNGESFVGFKKLYVNFQLSSLFRLAFTFADVSLLNPYGHVKVLADGSLNFSDLLAKSPQEKSPQGPGGELPPVLIQRLHIEKGRLVFSDLSLATPYEETLFPIQLTISNFSTRKNTDSPYSFTGSVGERVLINCKGEVSVNPVRSQGRLAINKLDMTNLWKYIQDYVNFKVTSGNVDLSGNYTFALSGTAPNIELNEGEFELSDFHLIARDSETMILSLPSLSMHGGVVSLGNKQVLVAAVTSKGAKVNGWLASDGKFIYERIFALDGLEEKFGRMVTSDDVPEADTRPWTMNIDKVELENYSVHFEDRTLKKPKQIDLDSIRVELKNISNQKNSQAEINAALKLNQTGSVEVKGLATINPVSADLTLKVAQNPVKPMQPYVDAVALVDLASGTTNLEGRVRYKALGNAGPKIRFEGQAGLENLRTVDRSKSEDLYSLKKLAIKGLALDLDPNELKVSEVFFNQPDFKVVIRPDGKINLVTILSLRGNSTSEAENGKKVETLLDKVVKYITLQIEGPMPITIDTVRVEKGAADFSDLFIKPNFAAEVKNLKGRAKGLSSKPGTRADVLLEGEVNKYSPVKISGQMNPLTQEKYADLAMSFENFDLSAISPYSSKFAGYTIEKGKLKLKLKYKVSENIITGENRITVEQLTLGKHVESPDVTELPVSLGVALLKDANGNIELDVPVRGDINDPHFDLRKIIVKTLTDTITRVVSSPFAALGSLIGGNGEELSSIKYAFGSATLGPEQIEKLDKLAKALQERPGLHLEVTDTADKENDRSVLSEIEKQPVDDERLLLLAQDRSRQIKTHLVETGGIPAERIRLTREQILESSEGDHARTNLNLAGS